MKGTVAIIGAGTIGAGWAARFLLNGWDVRVFDPEPSAKDRVEQVLASARLALPGLGDIALPAEGRLHYCKLMSEAVEGADLVQESVPERIELKLKIFQTIQSSIAADTVLASSTASLTPSELQASSNRPNQIIVAHPFDPVYLLPLVEVVASDKTAPAITDRATQVLRSLGMAPLIVNQETPAHIANRLQEAMWREALWLVRDGIATTADIDEAIKQGLGPRWAQMGLFENARIRADNSDATYTQADPAKRVGWSKLTETPDFDEQMIQQLKGQADAQGLTAPEQERQRDRNLVGILRSLAAQGWGAGTALQTADQVNLAASAVPESYDHISEPGQPTCTIDRAVPLDWLDYNGHMTESRYLHAFGDATDRMMILSGCDRDYVAAGQSFFTVETHIRHLDEVTAGAPLQVFTRVIAAGGKRMHLWHEMMSGERLLATAEHMLLHVDLSTRRSSPMPAAMEDRLTRLAAAQADLPPPDGLARAIGDPV